MQGLFIAIEGADGAGKTEQYKMLMQWLPIAEPGLQLVFTQEPGGTPFCNQLRELITRDRSEVIHPHAELALYLASRVQHLEAVIKPGIAAGQIVISSRYKYSTIAYQGYGRGVRLDLIHNLHQMLTNNLEADLVVWLDVDPEVGMKRTSSRGQLDRFEVEPVEFHRRVREGYLVLQQEMPERMIRVDANKSIEDVGRSVQKAVRAKINEWRNFNAARIAAAKSNA